MPGAGKVLLPRTLRDAAGVDADLPIDPACRTIGDVLDELARSHPLVERRLRDETGAVRRYVNIYVDGTDIRSLAGPDTPLAEGSTVQVIQSVAGG